MRTEEEDLAAKDLYRKVANLFNIWHVSGVQQNGYGYGGKITEKLAEKIFKKAVREMLAGSLGCRVIPQAVPHHVPSLGIPRSAPVQPVPLETGPTQQAIYQCRIACNAPPAMTAKEIDDLGRANARAWCKQLALSTHGKLPDLKQRLKKHYRV